MKHPDSIEEIEKADRETILRWWRFLPLDWAMKKTNDDINKAVELQETLAKRFIQVGGFTPPLSKKIGWDEP